MTFITKKIRSRVENPHNSGFFTLEDAEKRVMRFVKGTKGSLEQGSKVSFFCLVDPSDGIVVDMKHQSFGPYLLLAMADVVCDLAAGKSYAHVQKITSGEIDKSLKEKDREEAIGSIGFGFCNLILEALDEAMALCFDIPLDSNLEIMTPVPSPTIENPLTRQEWQDLSIDARLATIESILNKEIRPYIKQDEGDIEILNLSADNELLIAYKGACTSCYSSVGATLNSIQEILRAQVFSELVVIPHLEGLKF